MKNTIRLFGIIALVAVIGFSFAACGGRNGNGNGGNGGGSGGNRFIGRWENTTGSVWVVFTANGTFTGKDMDGDNISGTYKAGKDFDGTFAGEATWTKQGVPITNSTILINPDGYLDTMWSVATSTNPLTKK